MWRPVRRAPALVDLGVVGLLTALVLAGTLNVDGSARERSIGLVAVLLAVVGAAAPLLRRSWPQAMVAVAGAAVVLYDARDHPGGPIYLVVPVALVALTTVRDRRVVYPWAVALGGAIVVTGAIVDDGFGPHELVMAGWVAAAAFGGDALRGRSERVAAARVQQEEHSLRTLAEERLRIAQDLHDSVAHSMATISIQSGVAAHLLDRRPEQAKEALEAIRQASSDVLDELGAILGLLRAGEAAPRHSAPGLDAIDALVAGARANGLAITAQPAVGEPGRWPIPVAEAAYRVVQESITNVLRHAPGAQAEVAVADEPGRLVVTVHDDGAGASASALGAGLGLVGMRERVEATGGRLEAGPAADGGFEVRATWGVA
jgi:signal transduction histidine kinase